MKRPLESAATAAATRSAKVPRTSTASPTPSSVSLPSSDSSSPSGSDASSDSDSDSDSDSSDSSSESGAEDPPEGVVIYTEENPPSGQLFGYWKQRKQLFSREGVWLTNDAWFEVTPEKIARTIAHHITGSPGVTTVVDAFCGVGGNAIQFALSPGCERVIAIDLNPAAVACAKHNAAVYGVLHKIEFIVGDFFSLVDTTLKDSGAQAIFLSPPWGGPKYRSDVVFDIELMEPYSANSIVSTARKITSNIALYIPRTSNLNQLAAYAGNDMLEAIHYCARRRSKAITAYFGDLCTRNKATS